ncbi:MAG: carboxypeptidase-like regulatory domain-containing protein, partial [Candidatus Gastranaerophilales bacterium]|nr:carboxypeptidase-like regulatory domain-containing protein [Candidatus Gastranaerophilales bacterium]
MKSLYLLLAVLIVLSFCNIAQSASLSGGVSVADYLKQNNLNMIYDEGTGNAINGAKVTIPSKGFVTTTDGDGYFKLQTDLIGPTIMSVKANGYKPFSMTIDKENLKNPLMLGISKQSALEIIIDEELHHLGDNNFSSKSANAGDFRASSAGHIFSKGFYIKNIKPEHNIFLKIGSII